MVRNKFKIYKMMERRRMYMANVGCRIRKEFERPDRKLIEAFKDIPVANIDDCMNRTAAVDSQLKPMNKARLLGTAFTVKAPAGDE